MVLTEVVKSRDRKVSLAPRSIKIVTKEGERPHSIGMPFDRRLTSQMPFIYQWVDAHEGKTHEVETQVPAGCALLVGKLVLNPPPKPKYSFCIVLEIEVAGKGFVRYDPAMYNEEEKDILGDETLAHNGVQLPGLPHPITLNSWLIVSDSVLRKN